MRYDPKSAKSEVPDTSVPRLGRIESGTVFKMEQELRTELKGSDSEDSEWSRKDPTPQTRPEKMAVGKS